MQDTDIMILVDESLLAFEHQATELEMALHVVDKKMAKLDIKLGS